MEDSKLKLINNNQTNDNKKKKKKKGHPSFKIVTPPAIIVTQFDESDKQIDKENGDNNLFTKVEEMKDMDTSAFIFGQSDEDVPVLMLTRPNEDKKKSVNLLHDDEKTSIQEEDAFMFDVGKINDTNKKPSTPPKLNSLTPDKLNEVFSDYNLSGMQTQQELSITDIFPVEHIFHMADVANANKEVIGFRPVHTAAQRKFTYSINREYSVMGKLMNTKFKTSDILLLAAKIMRDPRLSKLRNLPETTEEEREIKQARLDEETKNIKVRMNEYTECKKANKIETLKEQTDKGKELKKAVDEFNKQWHITSKPSKIYFKNEEADEVLACNLFIVEDENGKILKDDNLEPKFYFKKDDKYFEYKTKQECPINPIGLKLVEELYYVQYEKHIENGEILYKETFSQIITDYDELFSAPLKQYPLEHEYSKSNEKIDKLEIQKEETTSDKKKKLKVPSSNLLLPELNVNDINDYIQKIADNKPNATNLDVLAHIIYKHEEKQKQIMRTDLIIKDMGIVNEEQLVMKTHLKNPLNNATNHGADNKNPNPEKFKDDESYVMFLPNELFEADIQLIPYVESSKCKKEKISYIDSKTKKECKTTCCYVILGGEGKTAKEIEKEICQFTNAMRKRCFPLEINKKYPWARDEKTGDFRVLGEKECVNWEEINRFVSELILDQKHLEDSLLYLTDKESEIKKPKSCLVNKQEYIRYLETNVMPSSDNKKSSIQKLQDKLQGAKTLLSKEEEVLELCLDIISLYHEPDINYHQLPQSKQKDTKQVQLINKFLQQKIKCLDIESRCELINEKFDKMRNLQKKYETDIYEDLKKAVENYKKQMGVFLENEYNILSKRVEENEVLNPTIHSQLKKSKQENLKLQNKLSLQAREHKAELHKLKRQIEEMKNLEMKDNKKTAGEIQILDTNELKDWRKKISSENNNLNKNPKRINKSKIEQKNSDNITLDLKTKDKEKCCNIL